MRAQRKPSMQNPDDDSGELGPRNLHEPVSISSDYVMFNLDLLHYVDVDIGTWQKMPSSWQQLWTELTRENNC